MCIPNSEVVFQVVFFIAGYFLPLVLIVGLYSVMLHRLWYKAPGGVVASAESVKNKKRVIKLVMIVIIIFAVCWLPIQLILLIKSISPFKVKIIG